MELEDKIMGYKILDVKADIHEDVERYFSSILTARLSRQLAADIREEVLGIIDKHFEKIEDKWATNGQLDD